MDLKDTIEMMESQDHKEQFKAEYYQTLIRKRKLEEMLDKWNKGELKFTPPSHKGTYELQCRHMGAYLAVLEQRAATEGIELNKDI